MDYAVSFPLPVIFKYLDCILKLPFMNWDPSLILVDNLICVIIGVAIDIAIVAAVVGWFIKLIISCELNPAVNKVVDMNDTGILPELIRLIKYPSVNPAFVNLLELFELIANCCGLIVILIEYDVLSALCIITESVYVSDAVAEPIDPNV